MTDAQKSAAALEIIKTVGLAIRELKTVPSGHLYARLMGSLSLDTYNAIIRKLESAKLIRQSNHLIMWIGD